MWYLLLLSMGLTGLQAESSNTERLRVQITIPKKIRSTTTDGVESQVSYDIAIDKKIYTVNLRQKNFLPHNFRVYSYNGSSSMKPLEQQLQNFCYYQGNIEGYAHSMVIINTCTGLRGLLQFENVTYGIEPLEPSIGFEHVVYKVKHKNADIALYSEDIVSRDLPYSVQRVETFKPQFRYLEMHIVVEKELYEQMGSDTALVTEKIFQLIGFTNGIFTSFNITVILSSLELWTDGNKISPVTGDINALLYRFLGWKKSHLVLRPHDVAFLLVDIEAGKVAFCQTTMSNAAHLCYREKPKYVGAVFVGKICDGQYSAGVALHPKTISLESFAVIMAQLLCLSMGISYDDVKKCQCSGAVCIMNPNAARTTGVKNFSNCSMADFARFISSSNSQCFQNKPHLNPSYVNAVCGNRILEEGEECDCGTIQECDNPNCCDTTTCKLKPNIQCSDGECCVGCKHAVKGTQCRGEKDKFCDLPEYCNGTSHICQPDHHIMDGHPCGARWICLNGTCVDGKAQCASLMGSDTEYGSEACFNAFNSLTDEFGNCGSDDTGVKKCSPENVRCGRLICIYTVKNILKLKNATIIYSNVAGNICISLYYAQDNQSTFVQDGTSCGDNKICKNHECVDSSYLNYNCPPEKCSYHGVCNELGNCHCIERFLPPNCNDMEDTSLGGSIDSGNHPPAISATHSARSFIDGYDYLPKPTRWPFLLLIPLFLILSILTANLVRLCYQRKKWITEDNSNDEQSESKPED